eukprot:5362312-Pyramimonas_sp.AAC.1
MRRLSKKPCLGFALTVFFFSRNCAHRSAGRMRRRRVTSDLAPEAPPLVSPRAPPELVRAIDSWGRGGSAVARSVRVGTPAPEDIFVDLSERAPASDGGERRKFLNSLASHRPRYCQCLDVGTPSTLHKKDSKTPVNLQDSEPRESAESGSYLKE